MLWKRSPCVGEDLFHRVDLLNSSLVTVTPTTNMCLRTPSVRAGLMAVLFAGSVLLVGGSLQDQLLELTNTWAGVVV